MAAPLTVGDKVWFNGALGTIVATTATTDPATGAGSITYGGLTYGFLALRVRGPDVPFVATDDDWFRVGLLQHPDGQRHALVLDDPQEGRLIRARYPGRTNDQWEAHLHEQQQVFVTCWEPGRITCKKQGAASASEVVGLRGEWKGGDGYIRTGWFPPSAYVTNGSGVVQHVWPDGTTERVLFPRGHGAWGQRANDRMWEGPDAPAVPRPLQHLYVVRQWELTQIPTFTSTAEKEVFEGTVVEFDVESCTINVTGKANSTCYAQWYGTGLRFACTIGAGGAGTLANLPAGEYHLQVGVAPNPHIGTVDCGARQKVTVAEGQTQSAAFGAGTTVTAGEVWGRLYWYGAEAAVGQTVNLTYYNMMLPPGSQYQYRTVTTDGNGFWSCSYILSYGGNNYLLTAAEVGTAKGYWGCSPSSGTCYNIALGGRLALCATPWHSPGSAGAFGIVAPPAYVRKQSTTAVWCWFEQDAGTGWWWSKEAIFDYAASGMVQHWEIIAADGLSVYATGLTGLCDGSGSSGNDYGDKDVETLGGTIHGNLVGATQDKIEADEPLLEDAARMGAERGVLVWGMEARFSSLAASQACDTWDLVGLPVDLIAFTASVCPYCGSEVWRLPDRTFAPYTYKRGYCMFCLLSPALGGYLGYTDARSYFDTPTIPSYSDWRAYMAAVPTCGGESVRELQAHWRPEDYREVNAYLADKDWLGPADEERWLAKHFTFATWGAAGFVDGTSIAAQEALLPATLALRKTAGHCPATIGPCQLKAVAADGYQYQGAPAHMRATCTRPDGSSVDVDFIIPTGFAGAGVDGRVFSDFMRLSSKEQVDGDTGFAPNSGFYTDVTALVCLDDPVPGSLRFTLVNDAPHRNRTGVPVTELAAEPYLVLGPAGGEGAPYLCRDAAGRIHRFLRRGGAILHEVLASRQVGWEGGELASDPAHAADTPSGAILPDGTLLCSYEWSGGTVLRRSRDDGATWETVNIPSA